MSFNTLSEENKELVSRLYGLKAGLSLISVEADRMRGAEYGRKSCTDEVDNCKVRIGLHKGMVESLERQSVDAAKVVAADVEKKKKKIGTGVGWLISGIVIFCIALSCAFTDSALMGPMLGFGAFTLSVAIGFAIWNFVQTTNIPGADKHLADFMGLQELLKQEQKALKKSEEEYEKLTSEHESYIKEYDKIANESLGRAMTLYRAVYDTYCDTLDPRDWESIDYLIYVYVSGRAEDLPTALRCLDDERRFMGIVAAIDKASAEVSSTIDQAFSSLGRQLKREFESLEDNINRNMGSMTDAINRLSSEIEANSDAVTKGMAAQAALQAKANKSTKQLADDLKFVVDKAKAN